MTSETQWRAKVALCEARVARRDREIERLRADLDKRDREVERLLEALAQSAQDGLEAHRKAEDAERHVRTLEARIEAMNACNLAGAGERRRLQGEVRGLRFRLAWAEAAARGEGEEGSEAS